MFEEVSDFWYDFLCVYAELQLVQNYFIDDFGLSRTFVHSCAEVFRVASMLNMVTLPSRGKS
jgi:hypothetical protein